jgi:hypothetical protein
MARDNRMAGGRRRDGMVQKEPVKANSRKSADELFAHRHDAGEWEEEPELIAVRPGLTSVVSLRMPSNELKLLSRAAAMSGETLSQYVRKAVQIRIQGVSVAGMTVRFTGTILTSNAGAWTEATPSDARFKTPIPANA